jgi:hypothetical protein
VQILLLEKSWRDVGVKPLEADPYLYILFPEVDTVIIKDVFESREDVLYDLNMGKI